MTLILFLVLKRFVTGNTIIFDKIDHLITKYCYRQMQYNVNEKTHQFVIQVYQNIKFRCQ